MATPLSYSGLDTLRALQSQIDSRYLKKADVVSYEIKKQATADAGFASTYQLFAGDTAVGDKINVAADIFIQNVSAVQTAATADAEHGLAEGDKYVTFTVGTTESENPTILYLRLQDLVDAYSGSTTITVSNNNEISLKVVEANGLSVDATNGLTLGLASATTPGALSAADWTKFNEAAEASLSLGTPTGSGNVITSLSVDSTSGELIADKGITALQETDFIEISAAEVAALWTNSTPDPAEDPEHEPEEP